MSKNHNWKLFALIATGAAALAIAIGIGRFSYTPILPYMLEELNLSKTNGGLIASWNFFGYLFGSLMTILPIFKNRVKIFCRSRSVIPPSPQFYRYGNSF